MTESASHVKEKVVKLTPRQRKALKTKERIYKTAVKMLSKYDFSSLTVRNICDEAGVSTGTFYHYFESKDDVWFYYLDGRFEEYGQEQELEYKGDIAEYVLKVYEIYLMYCQEAGIDFLASYYSGNNKQLSRNKAVLRPVARWLSSGIEKAREEGKFLCRISEDDFVREICIIIKGCIFEWCVSDGDFDLISCAKRLMQNYMDGVLYSVSG